MAALDQYLPPNISTHEEMISDRGFRLQTLVFELTSLLINIVILQLIVTGEACVCV